MSGSRAHSKCHCQTALARPSAYCSCLACSCLWSAGQGGLVLGGPSSREPCIINYSIFFQPCLPRSHVQRWIPTGTLEPQLVTSHLPLEQVLNQVGKHRAWEAMRIGWDFLGRHSFGVFSGAGPCPGLLLHLPFNLACLSVCLPPIYLTPCSMALTFHSVSGHWDSSETSPTPHTARWGSPLMASHGWYTGAP